MKQQKQDYTEEFTFQLKKMRPWALSLIAWFVLFIAGAVLTLTLDLDKEQFLIIASVLLGLLLPSVYFIIKYSRCPHCKQYMGRDIAKFCPLCGVQIKK